MTSTLLVIQLLTTPSHAQTRPVVLTTEPLDRARWRRRVARRIREPDPRFGPLNALWQRGRAEGPALIPGDGPCHETRRALDQLGFIDQPEERDLLLTALDNVTACAARHQLNHPPYLETFGDPFAHRRHNHSDPPPSEGRSLVVHAPGVDLFLDGASLHGDKLPWPGGDVYWPTTDHEGTPLPGGSVRATINKGAYWSLVDLSRAEVAGYLSDWEQTGHSERLEAWAEIYADLIDAPLYLAMPKPLRVWAWCGPEQGLVPQTRSPHGCGE